MPRSTRGICCCPRDWAERLVLLLVGVLVLRTWFVEGLIGTCPVATGSMAETLLGAHREVTCDDCGHRFVCGADQRPVGARAVCPNCGYSGNDLAGRPDLTGDRVLIDKTAFLFRQPRRWEVVAFRHPERADQTAVKRVAGLPGESVELRHGDLYIDGQIVRKTLAEQKALAILVHDANFEPTLEPTPPTRWQDHSGGRWSSMGGRFAHTPVAHVADSPEIDWLQYHHAVRVPGRPGEVSEMPVTDLCGYNQTRPRREEDVRPVADLLLSLRLTKHSGKGCLVLRATDGQSEFRARIDPGTGRWEVIEEGKSEPVAAGRFSFPSSGTTVEMSLIDRQFLLAFDGQSVAVVPYRVSEPPPRPPACPLAIGCEGGLTVALRDLRVTRDVVYARPSGAGRHWALDAPYRLGAGQFFVLGDNSPISEDSRSWPASAAVDANLLVGKPLVVLFPTMTIEWGRWKFSVPDLGRIRYIR